MATVSNSCAGEIAMGAPYRIANTVQLVSLVSSVGLFVVSILMLTHVVPGGLPMAITTGAVGVLSISGTTLSVLFGSQHKTEGKTPFRKITPWRVALFVQALLVGGSLISLGGLHAFTVIQGTSLLNVNQLAWGIIGTYSAGFLLLVGIGLFYQLRPSQIRRTRGAMSVSMGNQPTAAPYPPEAYLENPEI